MSLEIGDKVAVLDAVTRGVVTSISGNVVFVKSDGMVYTFDRKELVKINVEQHELTKFSDIDNPFLKEKSQEKIKEKSRFVKAKKELVMEVDLHIEKLIKSIRGMDNFDILTLQLQTAERKLNYCIQKRISKIIFIHGVGEGVLKTELHYLLNKFPVKYYDASYQKYGLGATEVYIYQNVI